MTEKEKVVTVVVDDVSPASSSTATTTTTVVTADKEEAITKLLEICEASNIDVDDKIRHALLSSSSSGNRDTNRSTINRNRNINNEQTTTNKAKRMSTMADNARRTFRTRETILGALVRRRKLEQRNESSPEADIIREIGQTLGVAGKRSHPFEVRIKDGSYSVKLPSVEGEKSGSNHQQQQFIPTVTNSQTLMKMARAIWGLVTSGRYQRSTDDTKSVLEGINLYLEGGKTYLVLGAPGSGKSTCE